MNLISDPLILTWKLSFEFIEQQEISQITFSDYQFRLDDKSEILGAVLHL